MVVAVVVAADLRGASTGGMGARLADTASAERGDERLVAVEVGS